MLIHSNISTSVIDSKFLIYGIYKIIIIISFFFIFSPFTVLLAFTYVFKILIIFFWIPSIYIFEKKKEKWWHHILFHIFFGTSVFFDVATLIRNAKSSKSGQIMVVR